jgi:hypothetical protein
MENLGIFYDHLVYFTAIVVIWYIFSLVLVFCTKKNLATLARRPMQGQFLTGRFCLGI